MGAPVLCLVPPAPADDAPASPRSLVFDLECVSAWDALTPRAQELLLEKHAAAEARLPVELRGRDENNPRDRAALNPWTGMIVCVALWDTERKLGRALFLGDAGDAPTAGEAWRFEAYADERDLLVEFWATLRRNPGARMVGFNTRGFDGVYLHVRSLVQRVAASRLLVGYRYSTREHLDLFDVMGFWGAARSPSLDVMCEVLGIPTPKGALAGAGVDAAWREGRVGEIAAYCARDVAATAELMARWETTTGVVMTERKKF